MIVVVEPHADDAYLSLGGHIERWVARGDRVLILTVYGSPQRNAECLSWAVAVGAEAVPLGLTEAGDGLAEDWTAVPLPDEVVDTRWLAMGHYVLWPLGLQHPEHRAVADLARRVAPDAPRYVEQPYASKSTRSDETEEALRGRQIVSWLRPSARKWKYAPLFKSQALFFHRNEEILRHAPEIVVR